MGTVPTQGNEILVDAEPTKVSVDKLSADIALAGWVMGKVDPWEDHRNRGYARRWKEYWGVCGAACGTQMTAPASRSALD